MPPPPNMPPKFLSETPRKIKSSSIPRQMKEYDLTSVRESLQSELGRSIFDEGTLSGSTYDGDIISDCWFPNKILPLIPNDDLLATLTGPDGERLYDTSAAQWDSRYLPPILHKEASRRTSTSRLSPGQEERELSSFMTTVMNALIRLYNSDDEHSSLTPPLQDLEISSPADPPPSSASGGITPTSDTTNIPEAQVPSPRVIDPPSSSTDDATHTHTRNSSVRHPPPSSSADSCTPDASTSPTGRRKQEIPPRIWSSSTATPIY